MDGVIFVIVNICLLLLQHNFDLKWSCRFGGMLEYAEFYPHSLKNGMIIRFQEGGHITGCIEVLEIYNNVLKM